MEARARLPNFRPCTIGGNRARSGGNPVHDFVDYATETSAPQSSRGARFVEGLIKICREDKAAAASFRRASSKTLEYQCWPALVRLGVDIEKDSERAAFSCIGSALAAGRVEVNGSAPGDCQVIFPRFA